MAGQSGEMGSPGSRIQAETELFLYRKSPEEPFILHKEKSMSELAVPVRERTMHGVTARELDADMWALHVFSKTEWIRAARFLLNRDAAQIASPEQNDF